jgi:hypothetical protein
MKLSAGRPGVRNCRSAASFPTSPDPPVELVKINGPGQHHQSGGNDVIASPATSGEPGIGDHAGDLDAEVITALRHLTEMINQRLQFGSSRSQQGFAVELGGHGLVFGGHSFSLPTLPTGRFILVASLYPGVSFAWATTWFCG